MTFPFSPKCLSFEFLHSKIEVNFSLKGKMLQNKKYFIYFWMMVKFYGLQPQKLNFVQKVLAYFLVLVLYIFNFALLIGEMIRVGEAETIFQGFKVMSSFVVIAFDLINFWLNSKMIEEFYRHMCEIVDETEDEEIFEESYREAVRVFKVLGAFAVISFNLNSLVFAITGKSGILIYTPFDSGVGFFAVWLLQLASVHYKSFIFLLFESFLVFSLSIINGYSKFLRKKIIILTDSNEDLVICYECHVKFKKLSTLI